LKKLYPVLFFAGLCWAVFGINHLFFHDRFNSYGIVPRTVTGLRGIVCSPFLHASLHHIVANTVPLLVLGAVIAWRSRAVYLVITTAGILLSGALTWLVARHGCHIGASGLVFCYFAYIIGQAWYQRSAVNILLAVVCGFFYGGLIWGLSPFQIGVSWEGHAAGLAAGLFLARVTKSSPPAKPLIGPRLSLKKL